MPLIAENHLQFIVEVALIMQVGVMLLLNIIPISLSLVLFIALILSVGLTVVFGIDALSLVLLHHAQEFTHLFGPIALFIVVTLLAAFPMMKEVGNRVANLKIFIFLIIGLMAIAGSIVHRDFLALWILGLLIGFFIISKSFRQKSFFTVKRIIAVAAIVLIGFGSLEFLSRILQMPVISPILKLTRIEENALPSLTTVINKTTLFGHVQGSSYWSMDDTGFASGYISLPYQLITILSLPFPLFYGVLQNKRDVIDYFVPGIFGFTFDFGYVTLICLLLWCAAVIFIGFKMLAAYREKRENGNRSYLGREALLIGALTAFTSQAIMGLFVQTRNMNGLALLSFLFLGSMVVGHILLVKRA